MTFVRQPVAKNRRNDAHKSRVQVERRIDFNRGMSHKKNTLRGEAVRWLHRPRYSRQELAAAVLVGFVLAWWLMGVMSCIKKPPAPPPIILDTGVDVCGVTMLQHGCNT